MKYILFEVDLGSAKAHLPVIFPSSMVHQMVADALFPCVPGEAANKRVIRAGEVSGLDVHATFGESQTLRMSSSPEDADTIRGFDYFHGIQQDTLPGPEWTVPVRQLKRPWVMGDYQIESKPCYYSMVNTVVGQELDQFGTFDEAHEVVMRMFHAREDVRNKSEKKS